MNYHSNSDELVYINLKKSPELNLKCIINGELDESVVVLMHGKPGKPTGLAHTQTITYLNNHGITCVRPFLYSNEPNTRRLEDSSLETYTRDFESLISYLKEFKPNRIFAIGHSYGALAILNSKSKIDAAALWEPTHGSFWKGDEPVINLKDTTYHDYEQLGDTTDLAAHKGYPLLIVSAGRGKLIELHERYINVADEPKLHLVVNNARHNFGDSIEVINELREQTVDWFSKFI
jgi:hypothetical protein